jgi:hypothetical protein
MWPFLACQKFTDVSEERAASVFRKEEWAKEAHNELRICFFAVCYLGLLFDFENACITFVGNVGEHVPSYTAPHPSHRCYNLKSDVSNIVILHVLSIRFLDKRHSFL